MSEGKIDPKIETPTSRVKNDRSRKDYRSEIASRVAERQAYTSGEMDRGPTNKWTQPWPGDDYAGDDHREDLALLVEPRVLERAFDEAREKLKKTRASQRAKRSKTGQRTAKRPPRGRRNLVELRF